MTATIPSTITVRVLLFGSYAEILGRSTLELELDGPARIGDAVARLRALPNGQRVPARPLCALNLSQATLDTPMSAGDELAILPPLAGG